jgi:hypothetical protein
MHTYENHMKPLWEVLLYIMRREAPRRKVECFHCILCGAKRRGKILSGFTVHYAARSAAADF